MPVWLYEATPGPSPAAPVTFTWSPSFIPGGGALSYDLEVSRTTAFAPADLVVAQRGLRPAIAMVTVPPGAYSWRVIIRADAQPEVNWQVPFKPFASLTVGP